LGLPLIINLCFADYLDFYLFKGNPLLLCIRLFFGPVPAIVLILSLPLLIWYPITRASHAKLLADIKAKQGATAE
jgi:Na+/melibiose symporter-like transporter